MIPTIGRGRWPKISGLGAVGGLLLMVSGCLDGPQLPELVPGLIDGFYRGDPHVTILRLGTAVVVQVDTYGSSCVSKGETRVRVLPDSQEVRVSPFDWFDSTYGCESILLTFAHSVLVELEPASEWTLTVVGLDAARQESRHDFTIPAAVPADEGRD